MVGKPSVGPVCVVGRVSRDGIRVLGDGVAVVTVLEKPVPCAADGVIAEGGETEMRQMDKWRDGARTGPNKSCTTNTGESGVAGREIGEM